MSDLTKRIITMSNQTDLSGADWREMFNMVEELDSKLDYLHEEIAELEGERDRAVNRLEQLRLTVLKMKGAHINKLEAEHTALVEAARAMIKNAPEVGTFEVFVRVEDFRAIAALIDGGD